MSVESNEALARHTDPDTSHEAAAGVDTTRLEAVVLESLRRHGPGTTEQLAERLSLSLVTVSPRLNPLAKKGLVERHGKIPNNSGRKAILWRAVEGGQ